MSDRSSRLRQARLNAGFKSARSAAIRFGWRPSTYTAHENGQNDYDGDIAVVYARAFRVEPEQLYLGGKTRRDSYTFVVPIVGYIGLNGGLVIEGAIDEYASLQFQVLEGRSAFRVVDDTFWPAFNDKQLVICEEIKPAEIITYPPQEVICRLANDGIYVGTLLVSASKEFELLRYRAKSLLRIQIDRCWIVHARIEKLSWALTGEGRASMLEVADPRWREAILEEY